MRRLDVDVPLLKEFPLVEAKNELLFLHDIILTTIVISNRSLLIAYTLRALAFCFLGAFARFLFLFGHGVGFPLEQKRFLVRPRRHACGSHMRLRLTKARGCKSRPRPQTGCGDVDQLRSLV